MWWRRRTDRHAGADASAAPGSDVSASAAASAASSFASPSALDEPAPHRTAFILIGLGGATLASFGIAAIGSVLAPVLLALVLTISVHPLRSGLERRGVPRGIATGSVILAVVLLLGGFVAALVISFAQFGTLLPTYVPELQAWAAGIADWLAGLGVGPDQVELILSGFDPGRLVEFVGGVLGNALGLTSGFVVLLTMLVLMAMDAVYAPVLNREIGARRPILVHAIGEFTTGVRKYMIVTTVLGAAQGLVNWLALLVLGVPGAPLWGILSFLCSFIPNIGYFIAIVPPLVFGGLSGGWPTVIAVIVVYGIVNGIIQSVIQPRVVGNAVALSQTLTFFSVLFWAVVLGPIGAILAIPLTLLVRMLLIDSNPRLAWIRPALGDFADTKRTMAAEAAADKPSKRARGRA